MNVCGQTFMKLGASSISSISGPQDIVKMFLVPNIIVGIGCYGISTIFWILALSKFDLSYAYPFLSIGYVLILVVSFFIFHESITVLKVVGVGAIIAGLVLISLKF